MPLDATIAVIDSGVDSTLGRILPGVDLSCAGDDCGHGSRVASTILSVVPDATIVPVRVMDRYGALESPSLFNDALAWIGENSARLGIRTVCAAFGDTSHSQSDERWRGSDLQRLLAELRAAGVAVVGAAGNWYPENRASNPQGMAWPAILREIVSAGELVRGPAELRLSRVTQRLHASVGTGCSTTVFAEPGKQGETSGAAAIVAGRLAALRMADAHASVDHLVMRLLSARMHVADGGFAWPAI